jgi:hypothetical protein
VNVPVGPGGAPGRRRGPAPCLSLVSEAVVYLMVVVVAVVDFVH